MESEGDGDGAEDRQRQERKEGRSYHDNYRHNPSFGSIILEDLYTSSGRIIILPIGGYLHILTFLSECSLQAALSSILLTYRCLSTTKVTVLSPGSSLIFHGFLPDKLQWIHMN